MEPKSTDSGLTETTSFAPHLGVGSTPIYLSADGDEGALLRVRASPGAKKNAIEGAHGEALRIRVAAPPVDGKANQALVAFLAKTLALPKRSISLRKGEKSRDKIFAIAGLKPEEVAERLPPPSSATST
jgi:uncharacterized protein (TIGR00251 family)